MTSVPEAKAPLDGSRPPRLGEPPTIWGDVLLDQVRSSPDLQKALANAFGVDLGDVSVVQGVLALPDPGISRVACQESVHKGGFPWRLTIYVYDRELFLPFPGVAQALARSLGTRCLISDDQLDPFTMTMVTATEIQPVHLDPVKLDDDEYWLA